MTPGQTETYRAAMEARCPADYGGGVCTLLVRRVGGQMQLLHHAALSTGAVLTPEEAIELADSLTAAARRVQP